MGPPAGTAASAFDQLSEFLAVRTFPVTRVLDWEPLLAVAIEQERPRQAVETELFGERIQVSGVFGEIGDFQLPVKRIDGREARAGEANRHDNEALRTPA